MEHLWMGKQNWTWASQRLGETLVLFRPYRWLDMAHPAVIRAVMAVGVEMLTHGEIILYDTWDSKNEAQLNLTLLKISPFNQDS